MNPAARRLSRPMPVRGKAVAAWVACAGALAGLCGCEYSATVVNQSRKAVVAELEHDRFLAQKSVHRSAMIKPGEEVHLGPLKVDPLEPVTLRVRIVDDVFGGWQSVRLEFGDQTFVVEDGSLQSWEPVSIRRIPNE